MLLTVEDVTAWVPQAAADTALIEGAIEQATALANGYCRRRLDQADYDERYDVQPGEADLLLRQHPVSAVAAVHLDPDGTNELLTIITDFTVDYQAGVLTRGASGWSIAGYEAKTDVAGWWPSGDQIVRVEYTAGYTPEDLADPDLAGLKVAFLELVGWRLSYRGGAGVSNESADGINTTREPLVRGIPESIAGLLERYVRVA